MSEAKCAVPQALIAEKAVIGAALQDGGMADSVLEGLLPEQCQWPAHITILSMVARMREDARPVDLVLVTTELEKEGTLDQCGGAHYVAELVTELGAVANWRFYLAEVVDAWKRREMLASALEMAQAARDPNIRVDEAQEQCEQRLFGLRENIGRESSVQHCKHAVIEAVNHLEKCFDSKGGTVGLSTGIHDLDRSTSGFLGGQMIVIAARPACGKSALGMQMALHAAMKCNVPTLVFSVEMPSMELMVRAICKEAEINLARVRDGFISRDGMKMMSVHAGRIAKSQLWLDDTPGLTVAQFRSRARRMKMRHGIGLIVVDYLQFMKGSGKQRNESREREVSEISKAMKTTAKELNIPVITLAQLNRDADEQSQPKLANLRESGSIEQDADTVLLIHRLDKTKKWKEEPEDHNTLLIMAKQRNGPTPEIKLNFVGEHTVFHNMTEKLYSNNESERQH